MERTAERVLTYSSLPSFLLGFRFFVDIDTSELFFDFRFFPSFPSLSSLSLVKLLSTG